MQQSSDSQPVTDVETADGETSTTAADSVSSTESEAQDEQHIEDAVILEALRELGALDQLPVHKHADVIERVHSALQDRLAEPE